MSSSDPLSALQRWRFDLAYDGRSFKGFAYQPLHETVVGLLRSTLASTLGLSEEPSVIGAGRTDAGVHAFHQVVHVDLPRSTKVKSLEGDRLVLSLNKQLRGRIQILRAERVSDEFHARFSATWREYRYLVLEADGPGLDSTNDWAWTVRGPLDLAAMNRSADVICGTHDFRAFCQRPAGTGPADALVRRVISARWDRREDAWSMSPNGSPATRLAIRGQSFCHNMVRCLVSTMVAIGQGRLSEDEVARRLASGVRDQLPPPAPARGLALIDVGYDEES